MKKVLLFMSVVALMCGCNEKSEPQPTITTDGLVGTWIFYQIDGVELNTNDQSVYKFFEGGKAVFSSRVDLGKGKASWQSDTELVYRLEGSVLTVINGTDAQNFEVLSYDGKTMKLSVVGAGEDISPVVDCRRSDVNYTKQLATLWEGHCITPGKDATPHRWRYQDDGTYSYYSKNATGEWDEKLGNRGKWDLCGDIFISTWYDDDLSGTKGENCELWVIKIENGVMSWRGVRSKGETLEFELKSVS